METSRKRVRRDFCPLTVSVAVACATDSSSPMMQTYNANEEEFEPDRTLSPCVIRPIVTANATDGSWPNPYANSYLANMKWYANGVPISSLPDWAGLYSVEPEGDLRGSLNIMRNCMPGEKISLHFEAELIDYRLGVTIPVKTDCVILSTIDKSEDTYGIGISEDRSIKYNPFLDKLHLYEYKVAHGLIPASSTEEAAANDGNSYLRTITIQLYKGGKTLAAQDYSVILYSMSSATAYTELTEDDDEVVSIASDKIVMDLRLIEKGNYLIKAFVDGEEVGKIQFSASREYQSFTCEPMNEAAIAPEQTQRYDEVQVCSEGLIVEHPENIIRIVWKTDTAKLTGVTHNEGEKTVFTLNRTGIGEDYTNDWLETYVEAEQKGVMFVATDGSSEVLSDENGDILIFN